MGALAGLTPTFHLSMRDIQTVMALGTVVMRREVQENPIEAAYGLVLRVVDPDALAGLQRGANDAWSRERARFTDHPTTDPTGMKLAAAVRFADNDNRGMETREPNASEASARLPILKAVLRRIDLENIGH